MAHQKKTNPENLHQGEGIQVEEVTLETENIHHPAEEAVKVIFIGHRPMNGRKALNSPGITGLVQIWKYQKFLDKGNRENRKKVLYYSKSYKERCS